MMMSCYYQNDSDKSSQDISMSSIFRVSTIWFVQKYITFHHVRAVFRKYITFHHVGAPISHISKNQKL